MADKVFNIIIKLIKQGGADAETVKGLVDIKNAMVAGTAIIGSVTAAYYVFNKGLEATVGTLTKTATEVEKFRNETGMTAEDASKLLVVLNDLEISAGDVETAFKFAEKRGFEPTIASLEEMQKKYDALNAGQERTKFLLDEFGKSGLTLQKFFETGDVAQRLADVNKNLIVTDATIEKVQVYKDELNNLSNTWEGLKMAGGQAVLPILIKFTTEVGQATNIPSAFEQLNRQMADSSENYDAYIAKYNGFIKTLSASEMVYAIVTGSIYYYDQATYAATKQQEAFTGTFSKTKSWMEEYPHLVGMGAASTETATYNLKGFQTGLEQAALAALIASGDINAIKTAEDALYDKSIHIRYYIDLMGGEAGNIYGVKVTNPYEPGSAQWEWWNHVHHIPGYSFGADFTVPAGYPNDSYPMRVQSGEHVTVTPAGATYNYNYGGSNDSGLQELAREIRGMRHDLQRQPEKIGTELDKRMK